MKTAVKDLCEHYVQREERAWTENSFEVYTRDLFEIMDEIGVLPHHEERAEILTALAFACFKRPCRGQVEGLARIADETLALGVITFNPETRFRLSLLFVRAWAILASAAGRAPENIDSHPPLPEGVQLPSGADIGHIDDPALREKAQILADEYLIKVDAWNTGQAAIQHLNRLAVDIKQALDGLMEREDTKKAFLDLLVQAHGLPDSVRSQLPH